jgi:hypothetical protein
MPAVLLGRAHTCGKLAFLHKGLIVAPPLVGGSVSWMARELGGVLEWEILSADELYWTGFPLWPSWGMGAIGSCPLCMYDHDNIISWQLNGEISVDRRQDPFWTIKVRFLALSGGETPSKQVLSMQIGLKVSCRARCGVNFCHIAELISRRSRYIRQQQVISILKRNH